MPKIGHLGKMDKPISGSDDSQVMDRLIDFLETLRRHQLVHGQLRAIFHIVIGRTIRTSDGTVVSSGVTWRDLAKTLQLIRWDKELVRELGLVPDDLPPRDRQRYWYTAIAAAKVTAADAVVLGDRFAGLVTPFGYAVGPAPGH